LVDAAGAITTAGKAWRAWSAILSRGAFVGRVATQPKTYVLQFERPAGGLITVAWSQWGSTTLRVAGAHLVYNADGTAAVAAASYVVNTTAIVLVGSVAITEDLGGDVCLVWTRSRPSPPRRPSPA
jgi:predicted branched-subunit amino acid permease